MSYKRAIEVLVETKDHVIEPDFRLLCEFVGEVYDKEYYQIVNSINKKKNPKAQMYRYGDI
jgi:hypothetical protein